MKRKKKSIWKLMSAAMLMMGCALAEIGVAHSAKDASGVGAATAADGTGFEKYIGYGYNPAEGVPLVDTANALHFSNPILDVNNSEMWANVNVKSDIDSTRQDSTNFTSSSAVETAEQIGNSISGGITGKVKMVTVNLDTKFEVNRSAITKVQEVFSYYSMLIRRRTVALQSSEIQLRKYLSAAFLADAKNIDSDLAANNFISKYGSHLLGGYTLGGLLETTNYFASSSSTVARSSSFDLKSEISAALKTVDAGASFAFSNTYGSNYDENTSTNKYHFSTYGGDDIPSLTIDDLFAYKGGELSDNKNLNYSIWTDSLNEDKSLAIVEVPKGSRMIGVWELLPETSEYAAAKPHLINAYVSQCANAVKDANYSDLVQKISLPSAEDPSISFKGYELYNDIEGDASRVLVNYVTRKNSDTSKIVTRPNTILAFDYNSGAFSGQDVEWSVSGSGKNYVTVIDKRNGVFRMGKPSTEQSAKLEMKCNGVSIITPINIEINPSMAFSGGEGTEDNPYLIANEDDFFALLANEGDVNYFEQHFRLINDLNFKGRTSSLKPLGTLGSPFKGTFDGDGHAVSGFALGKGNIVVSNDDHYGGFFGTLDGGAVKNLTLASPSIAVDLTAEDSGLAATKMVAAGALVGYSKGSSSVYNCKITNPSISIDRGTYSYTEIAPFYENASEFYVGGAIGRNEGSVDHLTVTGGSIKGMMDQGGNRLVGVGGAIGVNGYNATSSVASPITNTLIEKVSVYGELADDDWFDYRDTEVGGLVGLAMDINAENVNISMTGSGSIKASTNEKNETAYSGGLCGYIEDKTNSKNSLKNIVIKGSSDFISAASAGSKYIGFIAGGQRNDNMTECDNVNADTTYNSWKAYGSNNNDPSSGYSIGSGKKLITIASANSSSVISIDTANAKTQFVVGESFSAGSIKVTCDDEEVTDYWIDYSDFNPSLTGEYEISVSYRDEVESYKVYVTTAPISSVAVTLKDSEMVRYKDEQVTIDDFNFVAIHTNGETETIDPNKSGVSIIMDHSSNGRLFQGDNKFSFVIMIDGAEYSQSKENADQIIINAKAREFSGIHWSSGMPSFEAYTNTVLSSSSILKGASFEVEYDAGGKIVYEFITNSSLTETAYHSDGTACKSVQMSRNEANIDVVIPSISVGTNKAVICYDDYRTLEFTIIGMTDPNDHTAELNALKALIEAIPECNTMVERFEAIGNAKNYMDGLTWTSNELEALATKLQTYIDAYNSKVDKINGDIIESAEINLGVNGFSLDKRSASIISIILAIIFAI